jgi:hypothetical protein
VLEAEMGHQMLMASAAAQFMALNWQADSANSVNDSLLYVVQNLNTPEADWEQVAYYLLNNNTTAATS